MQTHEILNLVGRLAVAFYFLWATWFNIQARGHHIAEFKRIGMPAGGFCLAVGLLAQGVGSVMLVLPSTVLYGGLVLIGFTAVSDLLFHRFWTYSDPGEQVIHKFFLYEHVALIGGLLGLIAPAAA